METPEQQSRSRRSDSDRGHPRKPKAKRRAKKSATEKSVTTAPRLSLTAIVDKAAKVLPTQAPLHAFVHHNTLHAFEHLTFEDAVLEAADILGTEPYQTEEAFAACLATGRILPDDLDQVLPLDLSTEPTLPGGWSPRRFRALRLRHLFEIPSGAALRWTVAETALLEKFFEEAPVESRRRIVASAGRFPGVHDIPSVPQALSVLWKVLEAAAPDAPRARPPVRRRDDLLAAAGRDADDWTHPTLIRLCAAVVDQGVAYWPMPGRDQGLLAAFRHLYGRSGGPPDRWMRGLSKTLREHEAAQWGAEETVKWAFDELAVAEQDWPRHIQATLLSLRGWAGMMRQLELRPELAPVRAPSVRLVDYLAVQLTLDVFAARQLMRETFHHTRFAELDRKRPSAPTGCGLALVYEAFLMAQLAGVGPAELAEPKLARRWLNEVAAFDSNGRRKLLHLAYERRHRVGVLDGLVACQKERANRRDAAPRAEFQAAFCIDDREESFRRHLEELAPGAETFGFAGFFGVAMAYQGLEDIRARPLCPVTIRPKHYVEEKATKSDEAAAFASTRRTQGQLDHNLTVGSTTLTRGGIFSGLLGLVATVPLVGRCLFPRMTAQLAHATSHSLAKRPATELVIEREPDAPARADGLLPGYTVDEMTDIVTNVLRTMGLVRGFCPVVVFVGHGSSSLNNPHEAAHDCGATGGGRGGPNARAFARMANHPVVRKQVAKRGIEIPKTTWFVGAYHNTCDDSVVCFDEHRVPAANRDQVDAAKQALDEACTLDAHERCRRFETTSTTLSPAEALADAEAHANDLGQPRPEYGHATNAVCIVGRRDRTRGVFLDRRAFLVSYDPTDDDDASVLSALLQSVGPVGAGINLEYYFSFVDPVRYGSGTKLPHNIVGLIGVMDGHSSDLRTGLPWQMVEIHEPVRLLNIVEARPERLEKIMAGAPGLAKLIDNRWIQLVAWDPDSDALWCYEGGRFVPYEPEHPHVPVVTRSHEHYGGRHGHLAAAYVHAAFAGGVA